MCVMIPDSESEQISQVAGGRRRFNIELFTFII